MDNVLLNQQVFDICAYSIESENRKKETKKELLKTFPQFLRHWFYENVFMSPGIQICEISYTTIQHIKTLTKQKRFRASHIRNRQVKFF